jgi:hypothetical protein
LRADQPNFRIIQLRHQPCQIISAGEFCVWIQEDDGFASTVPERDIIPASETQIRAGMNDSNRGELSRYRMS